MHFGCISKKLQVRNFSTKVCLKTFFPSRGVKSIKSHKTRFHTKILEPLKIFSLSIKTPSITLSSCSLTHNDRVLSNRDLSDIVTPKEIKFR